VELVPQPSPTPVADGVIFGALHAIALTSTEDDEMDGPLAEFAMPPHHASETITT